MKKIFVQRRHNLGKDSCLALADKITDKLIERIGGTKSIEGDVIHYKHISGSKGRLVSSHDSLEVEVSLGLLVRSFGGSIQQEIEQTCDEYLKS